MGKSYRKPYASVTSSRSAKADKVAAARGVRRAQNGALRSFKFEDWDELIMPARRECHWNNVYSWSRDGRQTLQFPPHESLQFSEIAFDRWWFEYRARRYRECLRK